MKKLAFCVVIILVLSVVGGMPGCEPSARTQAVEYNQQGVALTDAGRYDEAIAAYTKAIELDPGYAIAYKNRGGTYYDKGQYDLAIADYSKAIELDPNYAVAYNNRGFAYYNKGQYDLTIADCSKAIELDPNYAVAYCNRGKAYSEKGLRDLAIADFNKAIELSTNASLTQHAREMIESLQRVTLDVPSLVSPPDEAITRRFSWEYGGIDWDWEAQISNQLCQTLRDKSRPRVKNCKYSVYVTHSLDDGFFQKLASVLTGEGKKLGYTNYQMVELAVFFVRNIPYSYDIDSTGREEYPRYPVETLVDNTGDCEDHAILLAELLRAMNYDAILLYYTGEHMAIGVADDGNMYGTYYEHNGQRYFYVETTPSGREIGNVPEEFKCPAYVWELVPAPVLGWERYHWPAFRGTMPLELTIYNDGTAPALGVTAYAYLDAGNDRCWSQAQTTIDMPPEETRTVTLNLTLPNQQVYTRVVFRISYDGCKVGEGSSDWQYFSSGVHN